MSVTLVPVLDRSRRPAHVPGLVSPVIPDPVQRVPATAFRAAVRLRSDRGLDVRDEYPDVMPGFMHGDAPAPVSLVPGVRRILAPVQYPAPEREQRVSSQS